MAEPTIRLRPATDDDHAAFLRLHPELGIDDSPPAERCRGCETA
jgi:hypothetical protein